MHTIVAGTAVPASRRWSRAAALALAVLLMLSAAAAPAEAKSTFMSRASGSTADVYWTQIDGTEPGTSPVGNVHIGWLYAYETSKGKAEVYGGIEDWDCEEGELPWGGGHGFEDGDEEPEPGACDWKGFRSIEAYGVPFSLDKKLTTARLTGTLTVYGGGHGEGGVVGQPYADIVWTGVGGVSNEKHTYRYKDGGVMYSSTWQSSSRSASMSGILGPMGFDPDLSGGWISTFKSNSKEMVK